MPYLEIWYLISYFVGGHVDQSNYAVRGDVKSVENTPEVNITRSETSIQLPKNIIEQFSRPDTPMTLVDDERDEFMKRENDLTDMVNSKESELSFVRNQLANLQMELEVSHKKNREFEDINNDINLEIEKTTFEFKESSLVIDTLKDTNQELNTQITELRSLCQNLIENKEDLEAELSKKNKADEIRSQVETSVGIVYSSQLIIFLFVV